MKRDLIITGIAVAVAVLAATSFGVWKFLTVTDPYRVEPISASPAPVGAKVGYTVKNDTRTLSIISSNRVVVVADPGASFRYEVLWLVERPRKDGSAALMEYTCKLPEFAAVDHIYPPTTQPPLKIQKASEAIGWQ
jgi:hypothetical protein